MTILGSGRYQVVGGAEPHFVVVHPHGAVCDCKGFQYRHACRHVAAVTRRHEQSAVGSLAIAEEST